MEILEQLILNGFATKDFDLLDGKIKFSLKTLAGKEQMAIEKWMENINGTPMYVVHNFSLRMLAYGLLSYQDNKFEKKSPEEKLEFIENLDTTILDLMVNTQKKFYEEAKNTINPDELENLSETPSADSASN
ncbi:hypothetical protein AYK24_00595 [Thermoplasmatales archaeon SG8-52-4]|nr:MAG: hypothetical protein AYK24_00595 [Thermoplasmatales archaeon SG8-52-4]